MNAIDFIARLDRTGGSDACWPYSGPALPKGYGQFSGPRGLVFAHRYAYELWLGAIPAAMCVMHRCDNPPCCNPSHLTLGTLAENNADMVAKGRHSHGTNHYLSKLTDAQVEEIRTRYFDGELGKDLAVEFGTSRPAISRIVNRRSYIDERRNHDATPVR